MLMTEPQLPSNTSNLARANDELEDDWKSEQIQESTRSYILKAKKAAQYIHIMKHAQVCNGTCRRELCKTTSLLLEHSLGCQLQNCLVAGCSQTKVLYNHSSECKARRSVVARGNQEHLPCLICAFSSVLNSKSDECNECNSMKRKDEFEVPSLPKRFRKTKSNDSVLSEQKER